MKNITSSKKNPFAVPAGYFDTLQDRVMARINDSEAGTEVGRFTIRTRFYITLAAAAACLLFVFAAAALYLTDTDNQQPVAGHDTGDETLYRWFLASDRAGMLAGSLDAGLREYFADSGTDPDEEDDAIIRFLERDNFRVTAIEAHMEDNSILEGY